MNPIQKLIFELKQLIFIILFILLKDQEDIENMLVYAVFTVLDFLQVFSFVFSPQVQPLWNSSALFNTVGKLQQFFNFSNLYSQFITWELYLLMFYLLIVIIFLIFLDIVYVSYAFKQKKFTVLWPLAVLRNFIKFSVTVLFLPITETLLQMVTCQMDPILGLYINSTFPDVVCFTGLYNLHATLSIIFNIFFTALALIVTLNYFESRITSKNKLARANSRGDVSYIINKIVL